MLERITREKDADPGRLRRIVDRALTSPPALPDAPEHGREHSRSYAEAEETEAVVLEPFRRLSSTLRRAEVALEFIEAARDVLRLRATDYAGPATSPAAARSGPS